MTDPETRRTYFVEVGFIFSLAVMLSLLELMHYFSLRAANTLTPMVMEMPTEMGKAEDMIEITLPQSQPAAKPEGIVLPLTPIPNIVANNVAVSKEITTQLEAKLKTDSQDSKISGNGSGMNADANVDDLTPFSIVEDQPTFPGGTEALLKYLEANIKYPSAAQRGGISGTVIISFVIERDGSISNVIVVHGIGGRCNEEAVRVVSSMPKWTPGRQRGNPVRVPFQVPIEFYLHAK